MISYWKQKIVLIRTLHSTMNLFGKQSEKYIYRNVRAVNSQKIIIIHNVLQLFCPEKKKIVFMRISHFTLILFGE